MFTGTQESKTFHAYYLSKFSVDANEGKCWCDKLRSICFMQLTLKVVNSLGSFYMKEKQQNAH